MIQQIDRQPAEPWKNGGGLTRTLATDGQSTPAQWRLSVADIDGSCAFSRFEGMDRISILFAGQGLRLQCGAHTHTYSAIGEAYAYRGEVATHAHLADGPCRFLNVMTRRANCAAVVHANVATLAWGTQHTVVVIPMDGAMHMALPDQTPICLQRGDYVVLPQGVRSARFTPKQQRATWLVIAMGPPGV